MLTGQNGILTRSGEAKEKTLESQNKEELQMALSQMAMEYSINGGAETFSDYIFEHGDDLKELLGSSNVTLDGTAKTITYKGVLYSVATDGKITKLDGIAINESQKTLTVVGTEKESCTLTATLTNISGNITWTSSEPAVATVVGNGQTATVQAVAAGQTTIKATCNGKEATCIVTVNEITLATSVTVSPTTLTVAVGGTEEVTATQAGGGNEEIIWSVAEADKSKVTVVKKNANTATVTGVQAGTATITATTKNSEKTANCTVTIKEPQFSDYTWSEINALAKEIAKDSNITNGDSSVTKTVNGNSYTVRVGDEKTIEINGKTYTVRVLGFNHDTLANGQEAYGDANITKAGISFEFKTLLPSAKMNTSETNANGWGATLMRSNLNSETAVDGMINLSDIEAVIGSNIIKSVTKSYIQTYYNANSVTTCNDKLWLLACSEIWSDGSPTGGFGYATTSEGSQYKYYASIKGLTYSTGNNNLIKYAAGSSSSGYWWLRSPFCNNSSNFCLVGSSGFASGSSASTSVGVAPGFAI